MPHSPTPWVFKEADGDEIIEDANGRRVHYDTQYYPSGLDSEDAKFVVRSVNRVAELEGFVRAAVAELNVIRQIAHSDPDRVKMLAENAIEFLRNGIERQ